MADRIRIPDVATKYILFQRTAYIPIAHTLLFRATRILIPSFDYNRMVEIEAKIRTSRIKEMYLNDMEKEYLSIKKFLPANCSKILDIGCGVAGIDIFLNRHYLNKEVDFYLLDKSRIDKKVYYMYEEKGAFYNSLNIAKEILINNGINESKVHLIEATEDNDIEIDSKVDLIVSMISWGFHYPVDTYLEKAYGLLNKDGILILDIRKTSNGLSLLMQRFGGYKVILEKRKYSRVCAIKQI